MEDHTTAENGSGVEEERVVVSVASGGQGVLVPQVAVVEDRDTTKITGVTRSIVGDGVVGSSGVPVTTGLGTVNKVRDISDIMDVHGAGSVVGTEGNARDVGADIDGASSGLTEPDHTADAGVASKGGTDEAASGSEGGLASGVRGGNVGGLGTNDTTSETSTIEGGGTVARINSGMDDHTKADGRVDQTQSVGRGGGELVDWEVLGLGDETVGINVPVTKATSTVVGEGVGLRAAESGGSVSLPVSTEGLVSGIKLRVGGTSNQITKLVDRKRETLGGGGGGTALN